MFKVLLLLTISALALIRGAKQLFKSDGDLNVALLLKNCANSSENTPYTGQTLQSSAIWTTRRLNFLNKLPPTVNFGLQVYETCTESDYFKTVFELYEQHPEEYLLGLISDRFLTDKQSRFSGLLDVKSTVTVKGAKYLYKASLSVLIGLGWVDNVTVIAPDEATLNEFYRYAKREYICLRDCLVYRRNAMSPVFNFTGPVIFFGDKSAIESYSRDIHSDSFYDECKILFVPIDGSVPKGLPENSFVVIPPHEPISKISLKTLNVHPNPMLFSVASPIINYVNNAIDFIKEHCNETQYKMNCVRSKYKEGFRQRVLSPPEIVEILQIEPLAPLFAYDVFQVQNSSLNYSELIKSNNFFEPFNKIFSYNIFDDNLTVIDDAFELNGKINASKVEKCIYGDGDGRFMHGLTLLENIPVYTIRTDSWVFAFLSISLLGITFCLAVLIFLLTSIFRRDILEGNPVLTIALLLAIMLMFASVLPFSLEVNPSNRETLCLAKSLSVTLSYALVLSLILSRAILLATSSKDIGFMSHIAGPVQSFLCLFIFGVQAALSLQIMGRCGDIFRGYSFIYLMSYNIMLLLLLLCLCPLIYSSQRNYREGKYFVIVVSLTTCLWCGWMSTYLLLGMEWREPIICFGLVTTAMVFLGVVFIPRTYLMTIAAARDKITSTLPSMGTATSALDIYRTQPVYDCVNIAAINAVTVARAGVASAPALQQPDLYSCPALPDAEDFDFRCETPDVTNDKVTRF